MCKKSWKMCRKGTQVSSTECRMSNPAKFRSSSTREKHTSSIQRGRVVKCQPQILVIHLQDPDTNSLSLKGPKMKRSNGKWSKST